jgi:16S rRNA (cytosine1402-N4)-methyltransferase
MSEQGYHETVLTEEVLQYLDPQPGALIVDGTLGHGGHTLRILSELGGRGLVVGLDRDPQMLATARQRIEAAGFPSTSYRLVQANHAHLPVVLAQVLAEVAAQAPAGAPYNAAAPAGILLDLGPSNPQLLDPARGMSWLSDQSLDMRMNPQGPEPTAAEIVNTWDEAALARLFWEHADERWSRRIAKEIVAARAHGEIRTGRHLGEIVAGAIPRRAWPPKTHPATRVFLALRIEVNQEFASLEQILPAAFDLLAPGGRLVVLTFHSGEDRRVKDFMRRVTTPPPVPWPLPQVGAEAQAPARLLTRKPVEASPAERERNPRSRSAKLRAIEKNKA